MLEADGSPVQPGGKSRGQESQPLNRYDQSVIAFSQSSMKREGGTEKVEVELKRWNDRALTRDVETLCAKVAQEQPRLPDGHRLLFRVQGTGILRLDAQEQAVV
jgi:hypothetical protein